MADQPGSTDHISATVTGDVSGQVAVGKGIEQHAVTPSPLVTEAGAGTAVGGIFISYRREDTRAYARTLSETLSARFGRDRIFRDIDSLAPGAEFPAAIAEAVGRCRVLLALIGDKWLTAEREGQRRLDDPDDYVRIEIVAALTGDTIVVPVLIEDAPMPKRQQLPGDLGQLADRNALRLRDEGWSQGVNTLAQFLQEALFSVGHP